MAENIPESVIVLTFIIVLLFILYKTGILKKMSFTRSNGSYVKGRRTFKAKYSLLKGPQFFKYFLRKNQPFTFYYNIEVAKGSLELKIRSKNGNIFDEIFNGNENGSIEITSKTRGHLVILNGKDFKGRCRLGFKEMY